MVRFTHGSQTLDVPIPVGTPPAGVRDAIHAAFAHSIPSFMHVAGVFNACYGPIYPLNTLGRFPGAFELEYRLHLVAKTAKDEDAITASGGLSFDDIRTPEGRERLVSCLHRHGYVAVKVPDRMREHVAMMQEKAEDFFNNVDAEEKYRISPSVSRNPLAGYSKEYCKETFHVTSHYFNDPEVWPSDTDAPGFRSAARKTYHLMREIAKHTLVSIGQVMDQSPDEMAALEDVMPKPWKMGTAWRLFQYYPPNKAIPRSRHEDEDDDETQTAPQEQQKEGDHDDDDEKEKGKEKEKAGTTAASNDDGTGEEEDMKRPLCVEHADSTLITISFSSAQPGLDMVNPATGNWIQVEDGVPAGEYLFIFVGMFLARLTSGYFVAPLHRVHQPPSYTRISMPFFLRTNHQSVLRTTSLPPKYRPPCPDGCHEVDIPTKEFIETYAKKLPSAFFSNKDKSKGEDGEEGKEEKGE